MVMGIAEILCSLQESRRNYRNVLGFPLEWRQNVTGSQRHREKILEDYCVDFCGSLQAAEIESLSTSTDCCTSGDGWRMGEHFYGMVRNGMEIPQGWASTHTHTYTHTHTHLFNGPYSGVSRYQKGKTNLDFTEARDSEWQWHQLGHIQVCT